MFIHLVCFLPKPNSKDAPSPKGFPILRDALTGAREIEQLAIYIFQLLAHDNAGTGVGRVGADPGFSVV